MKRPALVAGLDIGVPGLQVALPGRDRRLESLPEDFAVMRISRETDLVGKCECGEQNRRIRLGLFAITECVQEVPQKAFVRGSQHSRIIWSIPAVSPISTSGSSVAR